MTENEPLFYAQILDAGYVELQDFMGGDTAVVNAARVSFLGESKGAEADWKLLRYLMRNGHTSPFEMSEFKFRVKAPLFVARQWMRSRTWSYNEVSRRYTSDELDFYIPRMGAWRTQATDNKQASDGLLDEWAGGGAFTRRMANHVRDSVIFYEDMQASGVAREMARMALPQNLYTVFIGKVDAHNLMKFLEQRLHPHAQYEIQLYARALFRAFEKKMPVTAQAFMEYRLNSGEHDMSWVNDDV